MRNKFNRSWYAMKATRENADVFIYDEIGIWGITAADFAADMRSLSGRDLDVRLNTPGGSVFDGLAIFNLLDTHKGHVTTHIDGLAASIGSVIALAGDQVEMASNAFMMIHDPWAITLGTAQDHRQSADNLDKIAGSALDIYTERSDLSHKTVSDMMHAETWFTAHEARDAGFADVVAGDSDGDGGAQAGFDLSSYHNVPQVLARSDAAPEDIRGLEAQLRGLGYSKSEARGIAMHGFEQGGRRDAGPHRGRRDAGARLRDADKAIEDFTNRIRNAI